MSALDHEAERLSYAMRRNCCALPGTTIEHGTVVGKHRFRFGALGILVHLGLVCWSRELEGYILTDRGLAATEMER